jgi:hypothetical protein
MVSSPRTAKHALSFIFYVLGVATPLAIAWLTSQH